VDQAYLNCYSTVRPRHPIAILLQYKHQTQQQFLGYSEARHGDWESRRWYFQMRISRFRRRDT